MISNDRSCSLSRRCHLYSCEAAREGSVQQTGFVGEDSGAFQNDGVGVQTGRVLHNHKLCAWRPNKYTTF